MKLLTQELSRTIFEGNCNLKLRKISRT